MKKKDCFQIPWYMIYTPAVAIMAIMWALETSSGDGSMDVFEKLLQFLGLNNNVVVMDFIIAVASLAFGFIVVKWIATNKHLKSIDAVATTAPEKLDRKITETGAMVCEKVAQKIDGQDRSFVKDIIDIKCSSAAMQQQLLNFSKPQEGVSLQQGDLIAFVHDIYARHDRDQQEINDLRAKVSQLEERNKELEKALCCRGRQQETHGRSRTDLEPER